MDFSGNVGSATFTVTVTQGPLVITSVTPTDGSISFGSPAAITAQATDSANGATWVLDSMILDEATDVTLDTTVTYTNGIPTGVSYTPTLAEGWHSVALSLSSGEFWGRARISLTSRDQR